MVEQFHAERRKGAEQVFREKPVGLARFRRAGRVIVTDNHRACIRLQDAGNYQSDRWPGFVNCPDRKQSVFKQGTAPIQQQRPEMLLGKPLQAGVKILRRFACLLENYTLACVGQRNAPRKLHCGGQLRGLRALQSFDFEKRRNRNLGQCPERTEFLENLPRKFNSIRTLHTHAEKDRHEFGIRQRLRSHP